MASDETMTTFQSCNLQEEEEEEEEYLDHHHLQHPHNLSRLSVCTGSTVDDDEEHVENDLSMYVSKLSIGTEEDGGDADGEVSDDEKKERLTLLSSDSDEVTGTYSLPATPPRRRNHKPVIGAVKDYASDNEPQNKRTRMRAKRSVFDFGRGNWWDKNKKKQEESGEGGVVVITRPKGGNRSLSMALDEVKACRDLGFELEHHRILDGSSGGGSSPIANWRISSPGDDPRDVKARLRVWAQAVALESATSKYAAAT